MIPNNTSNTGQASQPTGSDEERINIRGTPLPVTRVSRRAILLTGVFGASLGLVVLMLGFGDHSAPRKDGPADENAIRPSGPIESVKDLPQDYSFDVNRLGTAYDGLSGLPAPATRPAGPSAQDQALAQAMRELAEQRRKMLEEQQKEQQAALDSPLMFGGAKSTSSSTTSTGMTSGPATMPTIVMLGPDANRNGIMDAGTIGVGGGDQNVNGPDAGPSGGAIQNHQQEKEAFLTQGAAVEPYLSKPLLNPISKYELKAGSVIPGRLSPQSTRICPGK